jgi:hypothetical protein
MLSASRWCDERMRPNPTTVVVVVVTLAIVLVSAVWALLV